MWIESLRFVNAGPFEDFSVSLKQGSVGIFGRNGRGKSTFLNFAYALLTNDFGRFAGVKTDCVRNTAADKDKSFISGVVKHGPNTIEITRNFRPTKANPGTVVVINGGPPLTNSDKAQDAIYEAIGADGRVLDGYVFKSQDRIYDFLTSIPSERAKAYQTLCQTEGCEKVWTVLGTYLNKDRELNAEVVDNSDAITQQLSELAEEKKELEARSEAASKKLCTPEWLKKYTDRISKQDRLDGLHDEDKTACAAVVAAKTRHEEAQARYTTAFDILGELSAKRDERRKKADSLRVALASWEQYQAYGRRKRKLEEEAEQIAAVAAKKVQPTQPDDMFSATALEDDRRSYQHRLKDAQKLLKAVRDSGAQAD